MTQTLSALAMAAIFERAEKELTKPAADQSGPLGAAMEKACQIVEKDAKDRIGEYHRAVGPFPAWPQLADATKAERARVGWEPNEPLLRLGTMRDSIQHVVVGNVGYVGSNDDIAVFQELGTARIPPRPFLGPAGFVCEFAIHRVFLNATLKALGTDSPHEAESALGVPLGRTAAPTGFGGV